MCNVVKLPTKYAYTPIPTEPVRVIYDDYPVPHLEDGSLIRIRCVGDIMAMIRTEHKNDSRLLKMLDELDLAIDRDSMADRLDDSDRDMRCGD